MPNPDPHCHVLLKSCRNNHIFCGMTCYRDNSIYMTFKFLDQVFPPHIPQVYTIILRATDNVLLADDRKCWNYAIYSVRMACICLQALPI